MAGRPQLPIGQTGRFSKPKEITPGVFEVMCRVRDDDGVVRRVKARGRSRSAAETALKQVLAKRHHSVGDLTGDTRLRQAGEMWLAFRRQEGRLAPRTLEKYESVLRLRVIEEIGELRLREATVFRLESWQTALRQKVAAEEVRSARAVLSGVLGYATERGALQTNPAKHLSATRGGRTRQPRAMTAAERTAWLSWLDTHAAEDPKAVDRRKGPLRARTPDELAAVIESRALGDLTRIMLATGARVGEAMAIGWDDVDLEAGTVHLRWHLIRIKGEGLARMAGTKRGEGRLLRLPSWAVEVLMRRRVASDGASPVFPDDAGGWRDPNLVMRWIRWSRDEAGFPWLTSHVWRQTVITVLDEAGLSTRLVADQVGHSQISQTQSYMARRVASEAAAAALEGLLSGRDENGTRTVIDGR